MVVNLTSNCYKTRNSFRKSTLLTSYRFVLNIFQASFSVQIQKTIIETCFIISVVYVTFLLKYLKYNSVKLNCIYSTFILN